jgi:hypothetical protein
VTRALLLLALLLGAGPSALARSWEADAGSLVRSTQEQTSAEGYLEPRLRDEAGRFVVSGRARFRADSQRQESRLEIRDSYLQLERGGWRGRLGFQSLSWGETFGFFVADLPNPRDWSDPQLLDIAFVKKPVLMAQAQWFGNWMGGAASAQIFFTPRARAQEFSSDWSSGLSGPEASEAGARVGRLFDSGLDASLFVISHLDRAAVFTPGRVLSAGASGSQALSDQWVLRTDQVFRAPRGELEWQGVAGLDWSPSGSFTLGAQVQHDPDLWGSSLRASYRGFRDRWDAEVFGFVGWLDSELWIQPKLTYSLPSGLSISARVDWVQAQAGAKGFFAAFPPSDRALLWVSYRY